ncbi:hypothetical protein EG328_002998 [Venturia inaequalis]|uniref:Tat pathway signal sequence n=1 Tax=Venturia inaequalis TaxID=5025 RepID=A0A8H3Z0P7_VENIN|nr:hypothetical protein EG328_002998 [Venturia inaequalis]
MEFRPSHLVTRQFAQYSTVKMEEIKDYSPTNDPENFEDDYSSTGHSSQADLANMLRFSNQQKSWRRHLPCPLMGAVCLLIVLATINIFLLLIRTPTDAQCTKQLSTYFFLTLAAPALEAVEYEEMDFTAIFNSTSIYRGPPTPEREKAWTRLTYKHGIEVPADKLALLNRTDLDHIKHVPTSVGTGYRGILEVFHQLHCLNMIRMYTWWQVGKYPGLPTGFSTSKLKNRMHIDHCFESLRMSLQCHGDVTPVLIQTGGPVGSKADFRTHHKCRNFQKLEDWIDNNWSIN